MDDLNVKKEVLRNLMKEMRNQMGKPVEGKLKKVSVVSDSEEGLSKGLNKAEQILKKFKELKGDSLESMSNEEESNEESSEDEMMEHLGEQEPSLEDSIDEEEMLKKIFLKKK